MNDLSNLQPLENYTPPSLPKLSDGKPPQLRKLPSRWQKNAAIIACAGVMGLSMLAGCGGSVDDHRYHWGGGPSMPDYTVYLTEQETLNIIRAQLEAAGLNLTEPPSEYSVELERCDGLETIGLTFFDAERRVGAVYAWGFGWRAIENAFSEQHGITVTAIDSARGDIWSLSDGAEGEQQKEEAREIARSQIIDQIQNFIDQLRQDGVL